MSVLIVFVSESGVLIWQAHSASHITDKIRLGIFPIPGSSRHGR
jgi:hypothetical protein